MYISPKVLTEIMDTIGRQKPECGGILAADQNGGIADYYFDADAGVGNATYIPSRIISSDSAGREVQTVLCRGSQ